MKFKTNAKCGGCTSTIIKGLKDIAPEDMWEFDLTSPDKVMTYKGDETDGLAEKIVSAVEKTGFKATLL